MLEYLKAVFGGNISLLPFEFPVGTPIYLKDNYTLQRAIWEKHECLLLIPVNDSLRLPTLKKHLRNFQGLVSKPCALGLNNLSSAQRRNLLESHTPFISASQQLFFPFWGIAFQEKFKNTVSTEQKMAPKTQLVFLYLYYRQSSEKLNLTQLSKELAISKATCSRAVDDLAASHLIDIEEKGTSKLILPVSEKSQFLLRGMSRMKTPVDRMIYLKSINCLPDHVLSGLQAVSRISMLSSSREDGAYAIWKKQCARIPREIVISKDEFEDFGGYLVEVWSYDPILLSHLGQVDDISLLLTLESESDERVQKALDEIRTKHNLLKRTANLEV